MKINGAGGMDPLQAYRASVKNEKPEARHTTGEVQGDTLEISPQARKIQFYLSRLEALPAIREDLVASIKERLREGTYVPDSKKIASGIIEERNMDKARQKD